MVPAYVCIDISTGAEISHLAMSSVIKILKYWFDFYIFLCYKFTVSYFSVTH